MAPHSSQLNEVRTHCHSWYIGSDATTDSHNPQPTATTATHSHGHPQPTTHSPQPTAHSPQPTATAHSHASNRHTNRNNNKSNNKNNNNLSLSCTDAWPYCAHMPCSVFTLCTHIPRCQDCSGVDTSEIGELRRPHGFGLCHPSPLRLAKAQRPQ